MPRHNAHRFARRDANHEQLAQLYLTLGCSLMDTSHVGFGFPDLVVGVATVNGRVTELVEVKTDDGEPTPAQERFDRDWRGSPRRIVRTTSDVIAHVKAMRERRV